MQDTLVNQWTAPLQIFSAYLNFETNKGIYIQKSIGPTRRINQLSQMCAQQGIEMLDCVFTLTNCGWVQRKKCLSDKLFFVRVDLSEVKQLCVFGFKPIDDHSKESWFRQNCLRIPYKLLKNNESVVAKMFDRNIEVPVRVSPVPLAGDDLTCLCVCRLREGQQLVVTDEECIVPEQLIFCRRAQEQVSSMQDQLGLFIKNHNNLKLKIENVFGTFWHRYADELY